MSETLKKLHEIGIDVIHAKTHISIHSLKAILEERFADINHIQYIGFLTLIEAEMRMNMDELRESYQNYREETGQTGDKRELFISTPKEPKSYKALIISLLSILLIVLFVTTLPSSNETLESEPQTANSIIEDASKLLTASKTTAKEEKEDDIGSVAAFNPSPTPEKSAKQDASHPFVLYPKEALWIGVVNLDTEEQYDTITSDPYVLDETSNLLISLGHGLVRVELNSDVQNLSDMGRVRFSYINGQLKRVSLEEFRELNKGKSW